METNIVRYGLRLIESDGEIRKMVLDSLRETMQEAINRAIPNIQNQIKPIIKNAIESQPEYSSLLGGSLGYELGVPDPENKTRTIIDTWINNISIDKRLVKITNNGLSGGFAISMIASDFADVLSLSEANVVDEANGYTLPWLEWLLLAGGKILVKDYTVVFGSNRASRTGFAIMKQSSGTSWRVPPEFAGTISNNWATRAIDSLDDTINNIMQTELEKAIL